MVAKFYFILTWLQRMGEQSAELVVASLSPGPLAASLAHMPIDSNFMFWVSSKHEVFACRFVSQWNHQPFLCCAEWKLRMNPHLKFPCSPFCFVSHFLCFKTFFPMAWKINENFYFPPPSMARASRIFSNEKIKHRKLARIRLLEGCQSRRP